MVEFLLYHPKVKGLGPAAAASHGSEKLKLGSYGLMFYAMI
jgi:hypothetical protein